MRSRHSSASSCCERGVEPTRSPDASRLQARGPALERRALPSQSEAAHRQPPQNFSPASVGAPHEGQRRGEYSAAFRAEAAVGRLSWLQDGQRVADRLAGAVYHAAISPQNEQAIRHRRAHQR